MKPWKNARFRIDEEGDLMNRLISVTGGMWSAFSFFLLACALWGRFFFLSLPSLFGGGFG